MERNMTGRTGAEFRALTGKEEEIFSESEKAYLRQMIGEMIAEALICRGFTENE